MSRPRASERMDYRAALALYAREFRTVVNFDHEHVFPDELKRTLREVLPRTRADVLELALVELAHSGERPDREHLLAIVAPLAARARGPVLPSGALASARELVERHGWPTGVRFVRGDSGASGSYVRHPLGYERPPSDADRTLFPKPTLFDVAAAIADESHEGRRVLVGANPSPRDGGKRTKGSEL